MTEKFVFHGMTTFIDKPRDTVIQNFQNSFISGDGSEADKINSELIRLIELIMTSQELHQVDKEDTVQAIHKIAGDVREEKANKLTVRGTLEAIKEIVSKASDIVTPATAIISTVLKYCGVM